MRPAHASVCAGNDNLLPSETQRPDLGGMGVTDPWFDRQRGERLDRRCSRFRKIIVNDRVAFYPRHIWPAVQCLGYLPGSFNQNCIYDVEGLMFDTTIAQPLQDRPLGGLGFVP